MKKMILFICVIAFFVSCNDDIEVDFKYQTNIEINNMDVIKDLKDYDGSSELFPDGAIDDGSKVRITLLLYNDSTTLFSKDIKIVNDFSTEITITKSLTPGDYTFVVCADIVEENKGNIDFECWDIKNENYLNDLVIKDKGYNGFKFKTIGVVKSKVTITQSSEVKLNPQPIGSILHLWFRNIEYTKLGFILQGFSNKNNYYAVHSASSNIIEDLLSFEYATSSDYTGYYTTLFFLPMNQTIAWIFYSPAMKNIWSDGVIIDLEKGKNKRIEVWTDTGNKYIYDSSSSTKSSVINNQHSFNKKIPVSKYLINKDVVNNLININSLPFESKNAN